MRRTLNPTRNSLYRIGYRTRVNFFFRWMMRKFLGQLSSKTIDCMQKLSRPEWEIPRIAIFPILIVFSMVETQPGTEQVETTHDFVWRKIFIIFMILWSAVRERREHKTSWEHKILVQSKIFMLKIWATLLKKYLIFVAFFFYPFHTLAHISHSISSSSTYFPAIQFNFPPIVTPLYCVTMEQQKKKLSLPRLPHFIRM